MTKIHGIVVTKDERNRYLRDFVCHHLNIFDDLFVYDDRSGDGTAEYCAHMGCRVAVRSEDSVSFMEHEGLFRLASWRAFEKIIKPEPGDWVFAIDADEFLVSTDDKIYASLLKAIKAAQSSSRRAVLVSRPEIWTMKDDKPFMRVDGYWNSIRCSRLFQYRTNASWSLKPMGCGSEPTYVCPPYSHKSMGLTLLHVGYLRDEDKQDKYDRYSSLVNHGHNDKHIKSILQKPKLEEWRGNFPLENL